MFSEMGMLLQQEGELVQASLKYGLAALRKVNVTRKGEFYLSFFQTSIGLERLMKVIEIVDHMGQHQLSPPSLNQIKNFGHNLEQLYSRCMSKADLLGIDNLHRFYDDPINKSLVGFYSEFAERSRYHNLNSISNGVTSEDPLAQWHRIVRRIAATDFSTRRKIALRQQLDQLMLLEEQTIVIVHGTNQRMLTYSELLEMELEFKAAGPYCIRRMCRCLLALKVLLESVTTNAQSIDSESRLSSIPFMGEFLDFAYSDKPGNWF